MAKRSKPSARAGRQQPTARVDGAERLIVGDEILLYGFVGSTWWDDMDHFTAHMVKQALAEFKGQDVDVRLNSGGGHAYEGVAIYNALLQHDGNVTVHIDGVAASRVA